LGNRKGQYSIKKKPGTKNPVQIQMEKTNLGGILVQIFYGMENGNGSLRQRGGNITREFLFKFLAGDKSVRDLAASTCERKFSGEAGIYFDQLLGFFGR
jgi:hypothetical protein